jgi:transcriptional regulator with XRE-family HTH domain
MLATVLDAVAPTLREVAREAGISYEAIRSYRKGLRSPPAAVIRRLAKALRARGGKLQQLADQLERQAGGR